MIGNIQTPDLDESCSVDGCDKPVKEWKGTGRKPSKCEEHSGKRVTVSDPKRAREPNDKLAETAASLLANAHSMAAFPLMLIGMNETAGALADEKLNAAFRAQAYEALLNDPALCRTIVGMGSKGGKFALLVAYAMYIGALVPSVRADIAARQVKRAEREETANAARTENT